MRGSMTVLSRLMAFLAIMAMLSPINAQEPAAEEAEPDVDVFEVPDTDAEGLLKFIEKIESASPGRPRSQAELKKYIAYRTQAVAAIRTAAEKIISLDKDTKSTTHKAAQWKLIGLRIGELGRSTPTEKQQFLDDTFALMKGHEFGAQQAQIAMGITKALDRSGDKKLALTAFEFFAELAAESDDARIRSLAEVFQGSARRLSLLGNKLEVLTGTLLDGSKFDWESYRGKVVLVDFWATWCGPCRAELPNLKKMYDRYHDQGFDVVGISLDRGRAPLESFLENEKLPWTTLFDENGPNKMASYYGIQAIPTVILVDKKGTVISTTARGRKLQTELEKIFGPDKESGE